MENEPGPNLYAPTRSPNPVKRDYNEKETSIPAEFYERVIIILRSHQEITELPSPPTENQREFHITSTHSQLILFLWINWLNELEGVLTSWTRQPADREIMESVWAPSILINDVALNALGDLAKNCESVVKFRKA